MDTGRGHFFTAEDKKALRDLVQKEMGQEGVERLKRNDGVFVVGEELEIRGSSFRVKSITPKRLILKLVPRSRQTGIAPEQAC